MTMPSTRSAPAGEHRLQDRFGTGERAADFYDRQVHDRLTPAMRAFVGRQTMVFLATSNTRGECDSSFRAGPPGFVTVVDDRTLLYPDYRGNGVMASAGNIAETGRLGLLFLDFTDHQIGLHVNGAARLYDDANARRVHPALPYDPAPGRRPELWIRLTVDEAYVHCSKYVPHLEPAPRTGRDSTRLKDADYFARTSGS